SATHPAFRVGICITMRRKADATSARMWLYGYGFTRYASEHRASAVRGICEIRGNMMTLPSQRITHITGTLQSGYGFFTQSTWARHREDPNICDFTVGNPHEMPLEAFSAALGRWSVPQNEMWYAYHDNSPAARAVVAASLREQRGQPFEDEDIFLT